MLGLSKTAIGIDIGPKALRAVRIKRDKTISIVGRAEVPVPEGVLLPSYTKGNILDMKRFQDIARLALGNVGAVKGVMSLSIPDQVVKVSIIELKDVPAKRSEIEKFLKWKSKRFLPYDPESAKLDYQLLGDSAMTAFVKDEVVTAYERALESLNFRPSLVSTPSLNLFNLFSPIFGEWKDFAFISVLEDSFSVMIVRDGCIDFHRSTDIGYIDPRIIQEINSSVIFYKSEKPDSSIKKLFIYTSIGENDLLTAHLSEYMDIEVEPLKIARMINGPSGIDIEPYGPAIASALGGMQGLI